MNLPFCGVRQELVNRSSNRIGIAADRFSVFVWRCICLFLLVVVCGPAEAVTLPPWQHSDQKIVVDSEISLRPERPLSDALLDRDARQSAVASDTHAVTNPSANKPKNNPANGSAKGKEALVFPKDFKSFVDQYVSPVTVIFLALVLTVLAGALAGLWVIISEICCYIGLILDWIRDEIWARKNKPDPKIWHRYQWSYTRIPGPWVRIRPQRYDYCLASIASTHPIWAGRKGMGLYGPNAPMIGRNRRMYGDNFVDAHVCAPRNEKCICLLHRFAPEIVPPVRPLIQYVDTVCVNPQYPYLFRYSGRFRAVSPYIFKE